jgi:hypothetical protein
MESNQIAVVLRHGRGEIVVPKLSSDAGRFRRFDVEYLPRPRRWTAQPGARGTAQIAETGAISRRPRQLHRGF